MIEITKKNCRKWSMLGMRRTYGMVVRQMAVDDPNLIVVTADLARFMGLSDYTKELGNQYVDVGISEQNMIGVAAGLHKEGFHVFAGTYATFTTARCLDQIRMNMGYMGFPIKIFGVSGGLAGGRYGTSHMALEDIANIRSIPGITVICPADCSELVKVLHELKTYDEPTYVRLTGIENCPVIYQQDFNYEIGRAIFHFTGKDVAIIATGTIVNCAFKVREKLLEYGIQSTVVDMHTIKPLDGVALEELSDSGLIVTLEEHMKIGGLGSAVADYYSDKRNKPVQLSIGVEDKYFSAKDYYDLLCESGLDEESVTKKIIEKWRELYE